MTIAVRPPVAITYPMFQPPPPTMSERRVLKTRLNGAQARERIFKFIVSYKVAHDGNSPSNRQILEAARLSSTSVVNFHLAVLEKQGRLSVVHGSTRQIVIAGGRWTFTEPKSNESN